MKRFPIVSIPVAVCLAFLGSVIAMPNLALADAGAMSAELKHWQPLADQGDADAQAHMGDLYVDGSGVKKSFAQAAQWYRKAAEQGHAGAQNMLGWQYWTGHGVPQNQEEGKKWFFRAANQGNTGAMRHITEMYMVGQDDYEVEYFWESILAKSNARWAEFRDQVATHLSPGQKAKLDQRIEDWKPVAERRGAAQNP